MATTTIPGGVTSNVVGSTYHPRTAEEVSAQAAMDRMNLERQWELEDKDWGIREQEKQKQYATDMANWQKGEDEAKMRAAFEKFYVPMAQSQWNTQQGAISGVDPGSGLVSGDPRLGSVYKKQGSGLYGEQQNIGIGQSPYEYRQDTNIPADQLDLDYAYEMWKAGQMMGAKDWKVEGTGGKMWGGVQS